MDQEGLFNGYDQIICSSPCNKAVPSEIRSFPVPGDYRDFITRYNGAHLIHDRSCIGLDETHVVLFSLEEIMSGESYTDPYGGYLGSELSRTVFKTHGLKPEQPQKIPPMMKRQSCIRHFITTI